MSDALDARLPFDQLDAAAQARLARVEAEATEKFLRLQANAFKVLPVPLDAVWMRRIGTMTPDALAELVAAADYWRRSGYEDGWHDGARDSAEVERAVGYATGQADLARDLERVDREHRAAMNRAVVASSPGVSYADLCERRGEHERAERQRMILRERGLAS